MSAWAKYHADLQAMIKTRLNCFFQIFAIRCVAIAVQNLAASGKTAFEIKAPLRTFHILRSPIIKWSVRPPMWSFGSKKSNNTYNGATTIQFR